MNKSRGFSLIELVIVIVIIGLLSAVALPRFFDVSEEAKKASIEGVSGSFSSAVIAARAQWEARGRPSDSSGHNQVNYDGVIFLLTKDRPGYPYALQGSNAGVGVPSAQDCAALLQNLLQNGPSGSIHSNAGTDYQVSTYSDGSHQGCRYTQGMRPHHNFTYVPNLGRVKVNLQ
ncbi:hypothetical protein VST7929_02405 [Vibrio stylophorae]|uniref:MSHA biogenesis protein MshB n=1 Tax=Vibrio stylophorae TaxID=659351 RepID=A0ABM8ZVV0_9VIBR|nr:prepilin-type N-terminal cleavage/methylation domain-containing protein [Vibrio stylophorae]CAH0534472.1 hypothetical protein VST7929_02405 [Vibrio stylophorae]